MPGTRSHRPMQQIHGLRPFFQNNARRAFRASAAKIRVHHMPPKESPKIGATRCLPETKSDNCRTVQKTHSRRSHFTFLQIPFNTVEYLRGRTISYPRNQADVWWKADLPASLRSATQTDWRRLNKFGLRATWPGITGKSLLAEIAGRTTFTASTRCQASHIGPLLHIHCSLNTTDRGKRYRATGGELSRGDDL
jgi:hypothetical protein